ncbi:MAG: Ig-like domain-containing protein [Christensenellales bacterium]
MKTKKAVFLALALLVALAALPWQGALASGTRYYVKQGGDDSKDGLSWENAKANLKNVMDAAKSGDEIWVAAGTYSPGGNEMATFLLKKGVKVYGGFAGTEASVDARDWATNKTTLSGKIDESRNVYHVVKGGSGATTTDTRLDGFTITGGNANGSNDDANGGGMYNANSSPTVANCTFTTNTANNGGGMFNGYSNPAVTNCFFSGNTSGYGGGMYNFTSNPAVTNCFFSGNTVNGDGGGMCNSSNSNPSVENCAFSSNTAPHGGGLCNVISSSPAVKNCTFSGNTASFGGGMGNFTSNSTVVNCTFSGNTASSSGGGMYNENSSPIAANTILWGNTAPSDNSGPDIYQDGSTLTLTNCVVGEYTLANNATISGTPIKDDPKLNKLNKEGNVETDPAKVYIYGLGANSSAKNKGLNVDMDVGNGVKVPDTDQRGVPRPTNAVDIGAYEDVAFYTITNTLTNITSSNPAAYRLTSDTTDYQAKLTAAQGYQLPANITVKVSGTPLSTGYAYNSASGDLRIVAASITGNIEIIAAAVIHVTNVSLDMTTLSLNVGGTQTLTATITPENATNKNVTWSSDDVNVASVDGYGKVTAKKRGTATITVTTEDGQKTATCFVIVRTLNDTWYVTQDGAGKKDGTSWGNASPDLKGIMTIAQSGDEIWVAKGTYSPGGDVTDTFLLKQGLKVYGGFAGGETDLSARNWVSNVTTLNGNSTNWHVVTGQGGATIADTRLDGFTITGGKANGPNDEDKYGGGMVNSNSSPTVANCTFSSNTATMLGGGMVNNNSSPAVVNCTFFGNKATDASLSRGGGMCNCFNSNPRVENCTFSANTATMQGGGMSNFFNSSPAVVNCTFSANTVRKKGGGMCNHDRSSPTVANCVFSGNTANNEYGGGMCNYDNSSPAVTNCFFSGNTAGYDGGGMYSVLNSSPVVVNCTFSGNRAGAYGGGMCNYSNSSPAVVNCTFSGNKATDASLGRGGGMCNYGNSSPTLVNTILWGNTAANDSSSADIYQNGSTLTLKSCVVGTYKLNGVVENTSGLIQENPRLNGFDANLEATGDPAIVYIYKLGSGSSAIDKGLDVGTHSGVTVPGTDQLGTARPKGAGVDIGAFEAVVCTVTYDKNGGGGVDMTPGAAVVGVPFELPACTFTPLAGNQFKAWAIGSVGGTQVSAGNTYTFDADTTVFALWEPVNYQVKVNGGTSTPPNSAAYNTPVTITANTPSGQRFIGWTVVSGGASLADASAATTTFTMPASDVEITANFENIPVTGVTLTPPTLTLTVGGAATLTAAVEPADAANQNVTWSSDKPAIAAVDNGVVTAVSVGTATITVTTAEGSHQATCTVTVNPVPVTGVKLNKASTALVVGGTETLYATVEPATATNRNVTWSSDKPAIATVDNGGKVTAVGVGQATITVKTDDGNKTAACQVTVSATAVPVTGVKLNKASTALVVGGAETLYATVEPATATNRNVTWSSDKPAIATVDAAGRVTAVGVGQATITVKTDDGNKTAACQVTVSAAAVPVTGVKLNKTSTALVVGGMEMLYATVEPATATNRNVTWSSDKPAVATVDAAGRVTAVGVGQATITVKTDDGNKTATCTVTVSAAAIPVTGVKLNKTSTALVVGGMETLYATVEPATATNRNVTWSSDKPAIATVDNGGKVTAVGVGQATITVKTDDGNKTAACQVTVSATAVPVTGVKLNKASTALVVGGAETLCATVEPATATNRNVTWSSDKPAVVTVDAAGRVTAVGVGQATITVKTDDGNKTAACTVTVSAAGAQYTTVSGDGQTHTRGDGEDLLLTVKRNIGDEKTFGLFRQMLKDGVPVAESNYTRAAGSLIIRLKSAWLDTLAAGLHHLSFVFEDGLAQASFTIRARPGSFEDVTTPSDSFTFTKRWQGGTGKSIDWTLYDEMDRVAHKLFNKKVVSSTEWRYNAWFDRPVSRYVVEKPVSGYKTRYENVGVYAGITDRCCDGGAIINYKIPKTGDEANLALWAGLALLGVAGISAVLVTGRRRKKGK